MKTLLFGCAILVSLLVSVSAQQAGQEKTPSFEFEKECGNPVVESMMWRVVEGTVVEVLDGDSIQIVTNDGENKIVDLVAIDTSSAKDAALSRLSRLVLNRKVQVAVNPSKSEAPKLVGVVSLSMTDINRELLEAGVAKYQTPESYSVSAYTACGYRIIERRAREAKKGMWRRLNQ